MSPNTNETIKVGLAAGVALMTIEKPLFVITTDHAKTTEGDELFGTRWGFVYLGTTTKTVAVEYESERFFISLLHVVGFEFNAAVLRK